MGLSAEKACFVVNASGNLLQVEVHPLWRNDDLIQYCNSEGIHVSAYCPLGTPWTSAKAVIRRADPASQHPVIQQIAKKYGKHPLHIIMRWGLQHGTSILAKSSNPDRIKVSHCPAILHPSRRQSGMCYDPTAALGLCNSKLTQGAVGHVPLLAACSRC